MARTRAWKTPAYTGGGRVCRPLVIPDDNLWLAAVGGALSELTKTYNWEQVGMPPQRAAEIAAEMLIRFYTEECGDAVPPVYSRLYRVSFDGRIQFSDDGGQSWDNAESQIFEPLPPRTEPLDEDKICLAATNAAYVLYQVYLELLEAFNTDSSIQFGIAAFAAILGLLLAALFAPVAVITALINFALGAFGYAYAAMGVLGEDDWTVAFDEDLICLLQSSATVNAGVVTFDYDHIRGELFNIGGVNPTLLFWLFYILQVIGVDGLNAAGATTAKTEGECDSCGQWCAYLDFANDEQQFVPFVNACGPYGTIDGSGWRSLWLNGNTPCGANFNAYHQIVVRREFNATLTRVDVDITMPAGGTTRMLYLQDQNGANIASRAIPAGRTTQTFYFTRTVTALRLITSNYPNVSTNRTYIHAIRLHGTGIDPFGLDNCEDT